MSVNFKRTEKLRRGEATMAASIIGTYVECSPTVQQVIREMIDVVNDSESDQDDIDAALATLFEALFPRAASDICEFEDRAYESPEFKEAARELDREQEEFAQRVRKLMKLNGVTQEQLANETGITQPAISNVLNRKARPQRRTVVKFAAALHVDPEELWPTSTDSTNQ